MTVAPADIRVMFPEFTALTDPYMQLFVNSAVGRVDPMIFQTRTDEAVKWLTAHLLAKAKQAARFANGAMGPVTGQTVADLSVNYGFYGLLNGSSQDYMSTPYGAQFEALCELCSPTPWVSA